MEKKPTPNIIYTCSFCGKRYDEVQHLIAGPNQIYICEECVQECNTILAQRGFLVGNNTSAQNQRPPLAPPTPNIDQGIQNIHKTIQNAMSDMDSTDPRYHLLQQASQESIRRLQNMKRPPATQGTTNTAHIDESYTHALRLAAIEKRRLADPVIDTTHLLLALLRLPSGNASRVFDVLDSNRALLIQNLEKATTAHKQEDLPDSFAQLSGMTPAANQATTFAYEESYALKSSSIGAEHLLLGLLRLEHNPEVEIVKQEGIRLDLARQIVSSLAE